MLKTRIIPCLLLKGKSLVKTKKYTKIDYIGDPINTCRIFNELEVDELCFLDIRCTLSNSRINYPLLSEVASECFMPLSYGGGIDSIDVAEKIFSLGFEKVVINTAALERPELIAEIANRFGSQSVVVAIDVKKNLWGKYACFGKSGTISYGFSPLDWARKVEEYGAGEILLTSIDNEGTWNGFDLDIIRKISDSLSIPVIANGGAGNVAHIRDVVKNGHASAVALGSMIVYQKKGMGVLVNFPDKKNLIFS